MSVIIREATNADREQCLGLLGMLTALGTSKVVKPEENAALLRRQEAYDQLLSGERGRILVADEEGVLLGMATVSYNLAIRYGGEYCQLEELIVHADARGKNVGGLLVQQTVADARSRGCAEFGLYLLPATMHNQPFYEKYGFVALGPEMRQRLRD